MDARKQIEWLLKKCAKPFKDGLNKGINDAGCWGAQLVRGLTHKKLYYVRAKDYDFVISEDAEKKYCAVASIIRGIRRKRGLKVALNILNFQTVIKYYRSFVTNATKMATRSFFAELKLTRI